MATKVGYALRTQEANKSAFQQLATRLPEFRKAVGELATAKILARYPRAVFDKNSEHASFAIDAFNELMKSPAQSGGESVSSPAPAPIAPAAPCAAIVVYERPAVNVLPSGDPIALPAVAGQDNVRNSGVIAYEMFAGMVNALRHCTNPRVEASLRQRIEDRLRYGKVVFRVPVHGTWYDEIFNYERLSFKRVAVQ